ncbi:MAG: acyl carrier protein [Oscillospiraceae bacterium]|nr:acyl carrier protein [Oscillospiraceae bacterium]
MFEKLREIFANQFGLDPETITESTDIVSDLGADSLDVVEMLMSLEDEYGITIEDEKVAEMKTVGDVVRCVEGLIES